MKRWINRFLTVIVSLFILIVFIRFVLPKSPCAGEKAKVDLTCVLMRGVEPALKMFKLDNGTYPTTQEGLDALLQNPNIKKYPHYSSVPYLDRYPKDPWGEKILYFQKGDAFILLSYGADREEGGDKDILYPQCAN